MEIIPPKKDGEHTPAYKRPADIPASQALQTQPDDSRKLGRLHGLGSTIGLFISAFIIAILLNTFVIQSYQVDGQSMEPTLQNNDRLIVNKIPRTIARIDGHQYVPHRGDIIIFNQDGLPGFVGPKQLIKRVIGVPGDHVVVGGGKVMIYNSNHPNGFDPDDSGTYKINQPTNQQFDGTLQANQLFVCGDNRPNSEDSRFFGPINTSQVVAKLVLRILPIDKAQSF